ncbi:MAG TPA: Clp protease N-terminal domain-containing protein [Streptosporangiaceae bacterium]|nr:Clp protease N-terminal domain-containing protein [Streptosporangiaceae bacterium]
MNALDVADLVVIAGRTLGLGTQATLDRLDLGAAQAAVSEAAPAAATGDPAVGAAALLAALVRHQPWDQDNGPVAVAAATTFLALNGWQADLDPPEAVREVVAALGSGRLDAAGLAAWLSPRLSQPASKEAPMSGWLPGRNRSGRRKQSPLARLGPGAREVMIASQEEARSLHHGYLGTEHLLLGLLRQGDGVAARALRTAGVSPDVARQQVLEIIGRGHQVVRGHVPFTPRAKKVLQIAVHEARDLGHLYVGTEHLLLGLLRDDQGVASQVLTRLGVDAGTLREHLAGLSGQPEVRAPVIPPGIRDYDLRIAQARQDKDAALDVGDAGQAATARDTEKQLITERDRLIAQWSAGADVTALGREIDRLRVEVRRLQDLLLRHGIEPEESGERSA